ncbi:MAG TPA: hydantoinase/oxoprolinase family protein [Solirubrobacteraceae bacterium]
MLLGVDVGGTFTDAVLLAPDGEMHTAKVPSTPADEAIGVLQAVTRVLGLAGVQAGRVERFAHGMTVATNALLEGRGARTALIATEGFTDVIELARQDRPHLYRLCEAPPAPLVAAELRFGAAERIGPEGVLRELDDDAAARLCEAIAQAAPEAVAVALLHSYADPAHELRLGELLHERMPEVHCSLSSDLVGTFREYERTATTALDATLSPLLRSYLHSLCAQARAGGLVEPLIMQSSGGLADPQRAGAHAALTVLSGPAGGVAGALLLAQLAEQPELVCFDMGGTSCDVCLVESGRVPETAERKIAGRPVALPALDIHTVGAGGGSIAWRDSGGALRVGPASAGAEPGPACYGRGGTEPTVTDANLLLGRLLEDAPLAGELLLSRAAAERAVGTLAHELGLDLLACAEGIVAVAESEMLGALRLVTVERGVDPRSFALMPFGGAGPLHAAALAEQLGISTVLCPRASGVLSALGLAAAAPRRDVSRTVMLSGAALDTESLERERRSLADSARRALGGEAQRVRIVYELRYRGQSFELPVERDLEGQQASAPPTPKELRAAFEDAHRTRYGYADEGAEIELVNIRASAWGGARRPAPRARRNRAGEPGAGTGGAGAKGELTEIRLGGTIVQASVLRGEPAPDSEIEGPALCALAEATLLIPPGWAGTVDAHGTIVLCRAERAAD